MLFEAGTTSGARQVAVTEIDRALTAQLSVAWAGEGGHEAKRLAWWRSDFASRFGGEDLFRRLLRSTWEWAVLQAVREAARRKDAEIRSQTHNPDTLVTLFRFGAELDERIDERLQDLKGSGRAPREALPGLRDVITPAWNRERFQEWLQAHGSVETTSAPTGRRLKGQPPASFELAVRSLVSGLVPLAGAYPLPHFRTTA